MDDKPLSDTGPTKATVPPDQLDAILARADGSLPLAPVVYEVPPELLDPNKLEDVNALLPVIGKMLEDEAKLKGKRVFPTKILRNQHIIAFLLYNPLATTLEVCRFFGISPSLYYSIAKSDTFRALAAQYQIRIDSDPNIQQHLKDTLVTAISVVQKSLVDKEDPDYAANVMDKAANRLGLGVKQGTNVQINNNIVTPDMVAYAREQQRRRVAGGN